MMFNEDIKKLALENSNFRKVVYTGKFSQLVVMSIPAGGDIGEETHPHTDQILTFVAGAGEAVLNGETREVNENDVVFVPAGTKHNFINKGSTELKLYTIYAPPAHKDGTTHATKADAENEETY